jgi:hypothetical protein
MTFLVTQNVKTASRSPSTKSTRTPTSSASRRTKLRSRRRLAGWPVKSGGRPRQDVARRTRSCSRSTIRPRSSSPLVKFQDKQSAMERTFGVFPKIAQSHRGAVPAGTEAEPKKTAPAPKAARCPESQGDAKKPTESSRQKGKIDLEAQSKAYPCREGTKQALLVRLHSRRARPSRS